jgi:drug/metabolite transporter (DMT)-like permease
VVALILLTVAFTVLGQLLVKRGMLDIGESPAQFGLLPRFVLRTFSNPLVVLGLCCALAASVAWTVAISRTALSFGYPFMALAIVLVLALSGRLFGESIPAGRWAGVAIVCVGLIVAACA